MMAAVELVDPDKSGAGLYDGAVPLATRVIERCVEKGQIPRRVNNVICIAPPLISTEAQMQRLVEVLAEAIRAG
jgi:adenosylmethionine-8-amino-7-oxononanoate aminotransferase